MMITCPECKKEISDKAKTCPHCGCNVKKAERAKAASEVKPSQYIGCLIMIIIIAISFAWCTNQSAHEPNKYYTFEDWVNDDMPSGE